jgi:hypothetical protein
VTIFVNFISKVFRNTESFRPCNFWDGSCQRTCSQSKQKPQHKETMSEQQTDIIAVHRLLGDFRAEVAGKLGELAEANRGTIRVLEKHESRLDEHEAILNEHGTSIGWLKGCLATLAAIWAGLETLWYFLNRGR